MSSPVQSKHSPWKNPNSSVKFLVKRKRIRTSVVLTTDDIEKNINTDGCKDSCPVLVSTVSPDKAVSKDINPFLTSPVRSKKAKVVKSAGDQDYVLRRRNRFVELLSGAEDPKEVNQTSSNHQHILEDDDTKDSADIINGCSNTNLSENAWSLRSKIRFTIQEGRVDRFRIGNGAALAHGIHSAGNADSNVSDVAELFHHYRTYWIFPYIPGINMFPKVSEKKTNVQAMMNIPDLASSLHQAWQSSFQSLYDSVRVDKCAYFYILFSSFSVLFRSASCVAHLPFIHALVTPTTSGLRHLLREEGIVFELPDSDAGRDDGDDGSDGEGGLPPVPTDDTEQWLESVGLDSDEVLPKARLPAKDGKALIPAGQSTAYVRGVSVHALYNYLLNVQPSTAELPPSLLSEVPFVGGSLQCVTCRCSRVEDGTGYVLEVQGPLLPGRVQGLVGVIQREGCTGHSDVCVEGTGGFTTATCHLAAS